VTPAATSAPRQPGASSLLLFAVPTFIWGTTWLVIKFQLGLVEPEVSVAWRFAVAAAVLLGWCGLRRVPLRFGVRDHLAFALLGATLFALNYALLYRAEGTLTSGLAAVLYAFIVFWNLLGARLFFGTPVPAAVVLGGVLGVVGVCLLFWPELSGLGGGGGLQGGVAYAVGGTLAASAGNLVSQRLFGRGVPVMPATGYAMGYAALLIVGWCAARGIRFDFDPRAPYVLSLLYLAVLGSVVAFVSYLTLLKRIGAGRAGYSSAVIPVVAMLASTLFEHYHWTAPALAGMALVLAGTVLVLRVKARAAAGGAEGSPATTVRAREPAGGRRRSPPDRGP
jgi:drug/metabolite transporter (DMT)-like permease